MQEKIERNRAYIRQNKIKVLERLRNQNHYKVVFYVYDCSKWKCQSLYELMDSMNEFSPLIVVTKNAAENLDNPSYQTKEKQRNEC